MGESKDIVSQWLERVDYDLSAARAMNKSGHWLYVAFMCQQAAEKVLKALWCHRRSDSPPFTHNLATLSESLDTNLSESYKLFLDRLNRYYIVGRYPTFKQKLAATLNKKETSDLLRQTEEFVEWCKKSIPTLKKL